MKSLPKFNTGNPQTKQYLLGIARYWIEQGVDGWRLDVPNEINDDSFWAEFRQVVKTANPQAYLVGEIWTPDPHWVGEGYFDGLMDYPIMDALAGLLATRTLDARQFAEKVEGLFSLYPPENASAMYVLVGSHDTERILTRLGNDLGRARLAYLFQFAFPGAPAIYYGDEIGLVGGKDPACRGAFLWDQSSWNQDLRNYIKTLVSLRKQHEALRHGDFSRVQLEASNACCAFARTTQDDQVLVVMNADPSEETVHVDVSKLDWKDGRDVHSLLEPRKKYNVSDHFIEIHLSAWEGMWLR